MSHQRTRPVIQSISLHQLQRSLGLALTLWVVSGSTGQAQAIPVDPKNFNDTVTAPEFNSWFQSGSSTLDGVVNPASSVNFADSPNGSFYKWSEQMFLWLTSPAPAFYGGSGGRIFDSETFFDVSPLDAQGNRTFIPHKAGALRGFGLRTAKLDAEGLPLLFDKGGRRLQLERSSVEVNAKLRVRNRAGELVDVDKVKMGEKGARLFMDKEGRQIEPQLSHLAPPAALRLKKSDAPLRVQRIFIDKIPVFLDPFGNVVEVEQGQADGSVLRAQNGSLVYYGIEVNDVFAYFRTSQGATVPAGTKFPTSQPDLNAITAFAAAHGKTFADPEALAVEVKTSWIEAAGLANPKDYITMTATIPTYDTQDQDHWIPTGKKNALLAMVGMHVVGSTKGHPEMIWATFEHVGNAPSGPYSYINSAGQVTPVPQSTAGNWLFCASNSIGDFNVPHMFGGSAADILAIAPNHITASDTMRWKAWGAASDVSPNPISGTSASSNSEVILMNNKVRGMLAAGDVRGQYIMTGATWTIGGQAPSDFNQVGTSQLANSTMETYTQGADEKAKNPDGSVNHSNCFQCHTSNTTDVSHIFFELKPLF